MKAVQTLSNVVRSYNEYYAMVGLDFDLCWWGFALCVPKGVLYAASAVWHVGSFVCYLRNR